MTPPVCEAGLYKGLEELHALLDSFYNDVQNNRVEKFEKNSENSIIQIIFDQAKQLNLIEENIEPKGISTSALFDEIGRLRTRLVEYQQTLIPNGLHIVGGMKGESEIFDILSAFSKNWIESNITLRDINLSEKTLNFIHSNRVTLVSHILRNDTLKSILGWIKDEKFVKIQVEETERFYNNQLSLLAELLVRTKDLIAEDSELLVSARLCRIY